jgi:hypothetical protein
MTMWGMPEAGMQIALSVSIGMELGRNDCAEFDTTHRAIDAPGEIPAFLRFQANVS